MRCSEHIPSILNRHVIFAGGRETQLACSRVRAPGAEMHLEFKRFNSFKLQCCKVSKGGLIKRKDMNLL